MIRHLTKRNTRVIFGRTAYDLDEHGFLSPIPEEGEALKMAAHPNYVVAPNVHMPVPVEEAPAEEAPAKPTPPEGPPVVPDEDDREGLVRLAEKLGVKVARRRNSTLRRKILAHLAGE